MFSTKVIALAVLSLTSSLAIAKTDVKTQKAKDDAWRMEGVLDMFFIDCERYPQKLEELVKAPADCGNWGPDPYVDKVPVDPWGREWGYTRADANHFVLKSLGADGKEGGDGENFDVVFKHMAPKLKRSSDPRRRR